MTGTCSVVQHAYLVSAKLGFSARLVFVVSSVERSKRSFVGLADVLELLHVITSSSEVNLGNLESCAEEDIHKDVSTCILA